MRSRRQHLEPPTRQGRSTKLAARQNAFEKALGARPLAPDQALIAHAHPVAKYVPADDFVASRPHRLGSRRRAAGAAREHLVPQLVGSPMLWVAVADTAQAKQRIVARLHVHQHEAVLVLTGDVLDVLPLWVLADPIQMPAGARDADRGDAMVATVAARVGVGVSREDHARLSDCVSCSCSLRPRVCSVALLCAIALSAADDGEAERDTTLRPLALLTVIGREDRSTQAARLRVRRRVRDRARQSASGRAGVTADWAHAVGREDRPNSPTVSDLGNARRSAAQRWGRLIVKSFRPTLVFLAGASKRRFSIFD